MNLKLINYEKSFFIQYVALLVVGVMLIVFGILIHNYFEATGITMITIGVIFLVLFFIESLIFTKGEILADPACDCDDDCCLVSNL